MSSTAWSSAHGDTRPIREEELFNVGPLITGFSSSSILEMAFFSSFSELGSEEEEEDEEEDDKDEEEEEQQEEWAARLWCGFSESLLSDRSDVMSAFSLFRPAFFSSSSPFLRLLATSFTLDLDSGKMKRLVIFNSNIRFDYSQPTYLYINN